MIWGFLDGELTCFMLSHILGKRRGELWLLCPLLQSLRVLKRRSSFSFFSLANFDRSALCSSEVVSGRTCFVRGGSHGGCGISVLQSHAGTIPSGASNPRIRVRHQRFHFVPICGFNISEAGAFAFPVRCQLHEFVLGGSQRL